MVEHGFLLLPIENHCGQNVQILKSFLGKSTYIIGKLKQNYIQVN
jgi:hypothetical protein